MFLPVKKRGEKLVSQKNIIIVSIIIIFGIFFYLFGSNFTENIYHNAERTSNVRQSIVKDNKRLENSIGDIGKSEARVKEAIATNSELTVIAGKTKESNVVITDGIEKCKIIVDRNIGELAEIKSRFRENFPIDKERE